MLPEKIMQSDLLDILFENRNKTYGAYVLRKSYNKTMIVAIAITLFITMLFSALQFVHHAKQHLYVTPIDIADPAFTKIDEAQPVKPQPKLPAPQHAAVHLNQIISSPPVIVNDNIKTQMPTVDDLTKNIIGEKNIIGNGAIDVVQPPATGQGSGVAATAPENKTGDEILNWAQVMPEYPGGIEALKKFMLRNLKQPDDLQPGEKIVVMASFVVNKNGEIEQIKIIKSGRADLDKEVQRVVNKMPVWKPGMQNGNAVAVYFNLPVTFMSEDEN